MATTLFLLTVCVLAVIALLTKISKRHNRYWRDRGMLYDEPALLYGNMRKFGRTKAYFEPFREIYQKYKNQTPIVGFFLFLRPVAVVLDLQLAKNILIRDFSNFSNRGHYHNERDDPISANIVTLGGEKWKRLRSSLTPVFSSAKMKVMFPTIVKVSEQLIDVLGNVASRHDEANGVEFKDLLARFSTDVVGRCIFEMDCKCLEDHNSNAEFYRMGCKAFAERAQNAVVNALSQEFPNIARKLRFTRFPKDVRDFYFRVISENLEKRRKCDRISRNDFLLQHNQLTTEEIIAQAFVFFSSAFETMTTMSFALYELAVNSNIQTRLRTEIKEILRRHSQMLTYSSIKEMKYLNQILCETLRKYSVFPTLMRVARDDYTIDNVNCILERGTAVIIPADAIHHDSQFYPNPSVFDPDRFTADEMQKRPSMAWLPFGDGPRSCLGIQFGKLQGLIGLASLISNFEFTIHTRTAIPLKFDVKHSLLCSSGGIWLEVTKLNSDS